MFGFFKKKDKYKPEKGEMLRVFTKIAKNKDEIFEHLTKANQLLFNEKKIIENKILEERIDIKDRRQANNAIYRKKKQDLFKTILEEKYNILIGYPDGNVAHQISQYVWVSAGKVREGQYLGDYSASEDKSTFYNGFKYRYGQEFVDKLRQLMND